MFSGFVSFVCRRRGVCLAAAFAVVTLLPAALHAQSTTTYYACYVKNTGTVYRIKTADTPQQCKNGHVEFSWSQASASGPRGYALVNANGTLDVARSRGFTSVSVPLPGRFCLTPAPGISPDSHPAVVTIVDDVISTIIWDLELVPAGVCGPGQYGVTTYAGNGAPMSVRFSIIVP